MRGGEGGEMGIERLCCSDGYRSVWVARCCFVRLL